LPAKKAFACKKKRLTAKKKRLTAKKSVWLGVAGKDDSLFF
jgi:hypothetical protein